MGHFHWTSGKVSKRFLLLIVYLVLQVRTEDIDSVVTVESKDLANERHDTTNHFQYNNKNLLGSTSSVQMPTYVNFRIEILQNEMRQLLSQMIVNNSGNYSEMEKQMDKHERKLRNLELQFEDEQNKILQAISQYNSSLTDTTASFDNFTQQLNDLQADVKEKVKFVKYNESHNFDSIISVETKSAAKTFIKQVYNDSKENVDLLSEIADIHNQDAKEVVYQSIKINGDFSAIVSAKHKMKTSSIESSHGREKRSLIQSSCMMLMLEDKRTSEIKIKQQSVGTFRNPVNNYALKITSLQNTVACLLNELKNVKDQVSRGSINFEKLKQLKAEILTLQTERDTFEKLVDDLTKQNLQKIDQLMKELGEANTFIVALKKENEVHKRIINELKEEKEQVRIHTECVQNIKNGNYAEAARQFNLLNYKCDQLLNYDCRTNVIVQAYNPSLSNFEMMLKFATHVKGATLKLLVFKTLDERMDLFKHKDPQKKIKIVELLRSEIINTISTSADAKAKTESLVGKLKIGIKQAAKAEMKTEIISKPFQSNELKQLLNDIIEFDINIFDQLITEVVSEFTTEKLYDFIITFQHSEQKIAALIALYNKIPIKDDPNNKFFLKLATLIDNFYHNFDHAVSYKYKSKLSNLLDNLSPIIQSVLFKRPVAIMSSDNEYLYEKPGCYLLLFAFAFRCDIEMRNYCNSGEKRCMWIIEYDHQGDYFWIHCYHQWLLYATDGGSARTWDAGKSGTGLEGKWDIKRTGENRYIIFNNYNNGYFCQNGDGVSTVSKYSCEWHMSTV